MKTICEIMGRGRTTVLAVVVALVLVGTPAAFAANGNPLILGKANNAATKVTGLVGKVASGEALAVRNPSGGGALSLSVGDPTTDPAIKTVAPMKVDSQAKVANLNADELDGKDSTELYAIGRSGFTTLCGAPLNIGVRCASASLDLPRQARVFVAVEADWNTLSAPPVQAICDLRVDGTSQAGTAIRAGETNQNTNPTGHYKHTGLTHVTGVLPAGNHEFAFFCREEDEDIEFRNVMVSAIMLGEG